MKHVHEELSFKTAGKNDFIDITDKVKNFVDESGIKTGFVNIQTLHTTAAVMINENEPGLIEDIKKFLEKLAPQSGPYYEHDDFKKRTVNMCDGECANGHAHCKAILLPVNVILNLINGKLQLGQWQRIFLVELDRARPRKAQILILGE